MTTKTAASLEAKNHALRLKIRRIVLDCLDDSHESATEVINTLAGAIADVSQSYFGPAITVKIFEGFIRTTRKLNGPMRH